MCLCFVSNIHFVSSKPIVKCFVTRLTVNNITIIITIFHLLDTTTFLLIIEPTEHKKIQTRKRKHEQNDRSISKAEFERHSAIS